MQKPTEKPLKGNFDLEKDAKEALIVLNFICFQLVLSCVVYLNVVLCTRWTTFTLSSHCVPLLVLASMRTNLLLILTWRYSSYSGRDRYNNSLVSLSSLTFLLPPPSSSSFLPSSFLLLLPFIFSLVLTLHLPHAHTPNSPVNSVSSG